MDNLEDLQEETPENMYNVADLRVELKFKNARLIHLIEDYFGPNASVKHTVSVAIGCGYPLLLEYISLRQTPYAQGVRNSIEYQGIRFKPSAIRISDFFNMPPTYLFPANLYKLNLPKKCFRDFESIQFLSLQEAKESKLLPPVSYDNYEQIDLSIDIEWLLNTLTPREQKVIINYFGLKGQHEHTLEEVGSLFGVRRQRIWQVLKESLEKLKESKRIEGFKPYFKEL